MLAFFTPESVQLPVLRETFCNADEIIANLQPYSGPFKDLINGQEYHKGKLIAFYPSDKTGKKMGGYKPEEHISPEQEEFQKAYIQYIRKHMEFKGGMRDKVQRRLKSLASKVKQLSSRLYSFENATVVNNRGGTNHDFSNNEWGRISHSMNRTELNQIDRKFKIRIKNRIESVKIPTYRIRSNRITSVPNIIPLAVLKRHMCFIY